MSAALALLPDVAMPRPLGGPIAHARDLLMVGGMESLDRADLAKALGDEAQAHDLAHRALAQMIAAFRLERGAR